MRTRLLVLALRDYFMERIEATKSPQTLKHEDDEEPEREPLPDSWMASCLQIKRLAYLERRSHAPPALLTQI